MRVLLLGASGFIGSELTRALQMAGHSVTGLGRDRAYAARTLPGIDWITADLRAMQSTADWQPHLVGIDAVVNASGSLQTGLRDNVERVQLDAIRALIAACERSKSIHFVQISASNADPAAPSSFMATKGEADALLTASGLSCTVLRPGLVIGRNAFGGTEMTRMVASLPGIVPVVTGTGEVQCVAMRDLVDAVILSMQNPERAQGSYDLVERDGRPLDAVIALHRAWLGIAPARLHLPLPRWLLRPVTVVADALGWLGWRSPLRSNSIAALMNGVSGNTDQAHMLLGREPLSLEQTLAALPPSGKADRWHARTALVYPLAMVCLFALWLGSGLLGLQHLQQAANILSTGGVPIERAMNTVFLASLADIALAALLVVRRTTRLALLGMLAASFGYVAESVVMAPYLWSDPLGPMLKVLPAIALTLLCLAMVDER